jgi:hypothetical protein
VTLGPIERCGHRGAVTPAGVRDRPGAGPPCRERMSCRPWATVPGAEYRLCRDPRQRLLGVAATRDALDEPVGAADMLRAPERRRQCLSTSAHDLRHIFSGLTPHPPGRTALAASGCAAGESDGGRRFLRI